MPFIVLKWTTAASFLIGTILLIFLLMKINITPKDSVEAFEQISQKHGTTINNDWPLITLGGFFAIM